MKLSVITASFNAEKTVGSCAASVAGQKNAVWEHLLIDGGSTDGTCEKARRANPEIRIVSEKDRGIYDAMNKGARLAEGDVLSWLNADDSYLPDTLEFVGQYFSEHPETRILHGNILVNGKEIVPARGLASFHGARIFHPATFVRRDVFEQYGPFDPRFRICADLNFFLNAKENGVKFVHADRPFTKFSLGGLSTRARTETAEEIRTILSEHRFSRFFADFWYASMRLREFAARFRYGISSIRTLSK